MMCEFPLIRAETSLTRELHARETRKIAFDNKFASVASGPEYSGEESNDNTLLSDHEIVGDLSSGTRRAMALTMSEKSFSCKMMLNPSRRGLSKADL